MMAEAPVNPNRLRKDSMDEPLDLGVELDDDWYNVDNIVYDSLDGWYNVGNIVYDPFENLYVFVGNKCIQKPLL
ncbi:hypothetical protein SLA2020_269320 [Shorea laevis]